MAKIRDHQPMNTNQTHRLSPWTVEDRVEKKGNAPVKDFDQDSASGVSAKEVEHVDRRRTKTGER